MLQDKKKILVLTDWFIPGYRAGGPIRSVLNIIEALKDRFDFSVITTNVDFGADEPYKDVPPDEWIQMDGYKAYYVSKKNLNYKTVKKLLNETDFDTLYLNSLFSIYFTLIPLWVLKRSREKEEIILAPRGMLGGGALAIKSNKKKIYLKLANIIGLYNGITWHASTEQETKEIRTVLGKKASVVVAPNIVLLSESSDKDRPKKNKGNASFVFISRISSKKNILKALDFFLSANFKNESVIKFDIYGPIEDDLYWMECQKKIESLTKNGVEVDYKGILAYEKIQETLSKYHFFLMPTSHENFGHAIVEALSMGCPVIISDQTPWRNLQKYKCGWDIPISEEDHYIDVLNECSEMDNETYCQWSHNAVNYVREKIQTPEIITKNRLLFEHA